MRFGLALLLLSLSFQGEGWAEGNPARGQEVVTGREANCLFCHEVPGVRVAGNIGPSLAGVGGRMDSAQLRARIEDSTRLNPETIMPSYHRVEGLQRVAREHQGKPLLTAQEVEDVVAYLVTLK